MKKLVTVFLVFFIFFGCSTTEKLVMSSLYSTTTENRQDINGNFTIQELLIWKNVGWSSGSNTAITLSKGTQNSTVIYNFVIRYIGLDWVFIDTLKIKLDNGDVITLKDNSPARDTSRSGSNVTVNELTNYFLSKEIINQLKNCNSLIMQFSGKYSNDPITIPPEGINAIKQFIAQ